MSKPKSFSTEEVAYASVAAALSTAFLVIGFYLQLMEFLWYFLATMMLMIPLCKGFTRASFFSYIVSSILFLVFCAFQFLYIMPYFVFMGLHPIVNEVMKKRRFNIYLGHLIKVIWFDVSIYALILFTSLFLFIDIRTDVTVAVVVIGVSTLVYFPYDFFIRFVGKELNRRFMKA